MAAQHGRSFRHGVIVNGWAGGDRSFVMPERGMEDLLAARNNVTAVRARARGSGGKGGQRGQGAARCGRG